MIFDFVTFDIFLCCCSDSILIIFCAGSGVEHGWGLQSVRWRDGRPERKAESRESQLDENSGQLNQDIMSWVET